MGLGDINRLQFEREAARRYISRIEVEIKNLKAGVKFKTIPYLDYSRDALILYCIENGYDYESNDGFGIFTIIKDY